MLEIIQRALFTVIWIIIGVSLKSYYGGLLCCAWSADSKVVATGGEDDMVSVFSVQQGCVVVYGEGHNSWISQVAFDQA